MKLISFFEIVGELKTLKRTGWVKNNVPNPESVADHSFRTAVMAMVLAPKIGANVEKSIKIALIHDIGEAKVGDLIKFEGKSFLPDANEKIQKEKLAVQEIMEMIDGKEYLELFNEYVENKTKEAQFVKQVDKLERALQAYEYEKKTSIKLQDFFESTDVLVKEPILREILDEIEKLRK
ncbi:MAG: HD domain-containing protein [Candidatus Levyibacteriota bacterium]|jgi:putative hydrolase of HD superfamily